jgi:hypothetical protein
LEELSHIGHSQYIPSMIDLLNTSENEQIKMKIIKILLEIKHNDAVPFLIDAIENDNYSSIQETLVRSCWENGLNYSNHLSVFVNLLINGSYMTAFEAYTVIENTEYLISATSSEELLNQLNNALKESKPDRKVLLEYIIGFLPSITKD